MGKPFAKAAAIAAVGLFGLATIASANHLSAPANLVCPIVGTAIETNWDDLMHANKYSVNVVATYNTGDRTSMADDTTVDFDFSAAISELSIPLDALKKDFTDADGAVVTLTPVDVQLRVKGLLPGRDQGRQNNPFSGFCLPSAA